MVKRRRQIKAKPTDKLSWEIAQEIRRRYREEKPRPTMAELGAPYGASAPAIFKVVHNLAYEEPAADVFRRIATEEGWTPATRISVLLQYITEGRSHGFSDFLKDQRAEVRLAAARRADPAGYQKLVNLAAGLRPGYPEAEAFSKRELFSPRELIQEVKRAMRRMRMAQTAEALRPLLIFAQECEERLNRKSGDSAPGHPPTMMAT